MAQVAVVFSHWYHLLEGLQESPKSFYESLESAIKKRELPDIAISRVDYHEGGVFSAKREYLRVSRQNQVFDICAAPFGAGFFVSWWLGELKPSWGPLVALGAVLFIIVAFLFFISTVGFFGGLLLTIVIIPLLFVGAGYLIKEGSSATESAVLAIPVLGALYARFFMAITYYKIDTTLMFQESVRHAVLEVVDQVTQARGLRSLSDSERKPILGELFKK